jgi:hemoglobin
LYQRLGGYDAIAAVTDDFLSRLLGDPKMAPYFENVDAKGKQRIRQMIVDQLCAASGGPCVYVGATMPTAHKDLHISERAFGVAAEYLGQSLDKFHVPLKEKTELLTIVASTKNDIINK